MAKLKIIWIERDLTKIDKETNDAIRMDWDNGRHQRIDIKGGNPLQVIAALKAAALALERELHEGEI